GGEPPVAPARRRAGGGDRRHSGRGSPGHPGGWGFRGRSGGQGPGGPGPGGRRVHPGEPGRPVNRVDEAAREALAGRLIVLPTDTVYGMGTRPDDPQATGRLFEAKRRPRDLTLPVLVASEDDASSVGVMDGRARALARRFWPGPLTLVIPRAERSREWDLGGDTGTVGLRRPRHLLALAVLERA